jgi:hypothetical protein
MLSTSSARPLNLDGMQSFSYSRLLSWQGICRFEAFSNSGCLVGQRQVQLSWQSTVSNGSA